MDSRSQSCYWCFAATSDWVSHCVIYPGDLVIVDRSIEAEPFHIVIAVANCEPLSKRLVREGSQVVLKYENPRYPSRYLLDGEELQIWSVVTYSVRSHDKF